ncbi:unnamed protein product [Peronospora belbahrii]|uniref:Uncharacterized protein n=1 Tax=Peronospora belbahrii TaxID=622444 RepID=A0ABN8D1F6_9STRA|nr:unnamed protein product [Peronospora belbahrii]
MKLLLSYVTNGGDLELLDKSCVNEMPPFNMNLTFAAQRNQLATNYGRARISQLSDLAGKKPTATRIATM